MDMIEINQAQCIGCGRCVKDCVAQRLKLEDGKAVVTGGCIQCGHCVAVCPKNAVRIPEYDMDDVETFDRESFSLDPVQLLHTIKFRRSIRSYQSIPVEQDKLSMMLQAGRYTATAKNNQDCQFIFVQQELDTLKKLVWDFIDQLQNSKTSDLPRELLPLSVFNRRRKADPADDFLFRNAPVVIFITSDWHLDAGLAAQNMELMAASQGLGVLYNGYLSGIADRNEELKAWLGIEGKNIKACMLLGYPDRSYLRTAPRKPANVIWR